MNEHETEYQEKLLNCKDCGRDFVFTVGEQAFFAAQQFMPPSRCHACRQSRRVWKQQQGQR